MCKKTEDDQEKESQTAFVFLASSLNIELVYSILKGITKFSKFCFEDPDTVNQSFFTKTMQEVVPEIDSFSGNATVSFDELKIKKTDWSRVTNLDMTIDWSQITNDYDIQIEDETNLIQLPDDHARRGYKSENQSSYFQDFNEETENMPSVEIKTIRRKVSVTFHKYKLFQKIHERAGLSLETLHQSLHPNFNHNTVFNAGEGAGRSGSFFFFSHDNRFIIKTLTQSELNLFLKILPDYSFHIEHNVNSLLAKILGAFTVKSEIIDTVHVVLMENTLRLQENSSFDAVFDLKGSSVNRDSPPDSFILKDLNFIRMSQQPDFINLQSSKIPSLRRAMKSDIKFLLSKNLMDFSLLVGIEEKLPLKKSLNISIAAPAQSRQSINQSLTEEQLSGSFAVYDKEIGQRISLTQSFDKNCSLSHIYQSDSQLLHLSIIDYLQEWNLSKKLERVVKINLLNLNPDGLSVIQPVLYARRFQRFMQQYLIKF